MQVVCLECLVESSVKGDAGGGPSNPLNHFVRLNRSVPYPPGISQVVVPAVPSSKTPLDTLDKPLYKSVSFKTLERSFRSISIHVTRPLVPLRFFYSGTSADRVPQSHLNSIQNEPGPGLGVGSLLILFSQHESLSFRLFRRLSEFRTREHE